MVIQLIKGSSEDVCPRLLVSMWRDFIVHDTVSDVVQPFFSPEGTVARPPVCATDVAELLTTSVSMSARPREGIGISLTDK